MNYQAVLNGLNTYFSYFWGFITAENLKSAEAQKPQWTTNSRYKADAKLFLKEFLDPNVILGTRFSTNKDTTTNYIMVDVDTLGSIHPRENPQNYKKLIDAFEAAGLPGRIIVQSSFSLGLHLYFPLSKAIPVFAASCWAKKIVESAGLKIQDGHLEVFPNCKGYSKERIINYKAHRLPLQPETGSYLLDDEFNIVSDRFSTFIRQMDFVASRKNIIDEKIETDIKVAKDAVYIERIARTRSKKAQSIIDEWYSDLQFQIELGFVSKGQTNELLCQIAKYGRIFLALEDEALTDYIVETITNAPGYQEYCQHHSEIRRRASDRALGAMKYYWTLGTEPKRSGTYKAHFHANTDMREKHTLKDTRAAQYRICEAVEWLWQNIQQLPHTIRAYRQLIVDTVKQRHQVSTSIGTLNKHKQLWHPKELGCELPAKAEQATSKPQSDEANHPAESTKPAPELNVSDVELPKENENFKPAPELDVSDVSIMKVWKRDFERVVRDESFDVWQTQADSKRATGNQQNPKDQSFCRQMVAGGEPEDEDSNFEANQIYPVRKINNSLKVSSFIKSSQLPKPFMCGILSSAKGLTGLSFYELAKALHFVLLREYCEASIKQPELVFRFSSHIQKNLTGLIERKGEQISTMQPIFSGSEVVIQTDCLHSTYFRDNPNQILVYIKPLIGAEDWLNGIAVPLGLLTPVRIV